jgi:hypothetical protein
MVDNLLCQGRLNSSLAANFSVHQTKRTLCDTYLRSLKVALRINFEFPAESTHNHMDT